MVKYMAIIFGILGAFAGLVALPFQHFIHGMEAPNLLWLVKVPFLGLCFGVGGAGLATVVFALLEGLIELCDPNVHWPRI